MRRWKVDTNARQDANLLLSSVSLPGGVQVNRHTHTVEFDIYPVQFFRDVKTKLMNFK